MIPATLDRAGIWPTPLEGDDMIECTCSLCGVKFPYDPPRPQAKRRRCDECKRAIHRAHTRQWNMANPGKRREIRQGWVDRNLDQMEACRRSWRDRNPENVRVSRRKAKKNNPIANRASVRRRKAIKLGAPTFPFTSDQLIARLAYFGNLCWMCGDPGDSLDHVKPLSKGGAHMLCNLRPACVPCNSRKKDRWPL